MLRFFNLEILLRFYLAFSQCFSGIYQTCERQSEFLRWYLILQFYLTCKIRENLMHTKKYVFYSIDIVSLLCETSVPTNT